MKWFEDIKVVTRSLNSKERQSNGYKKRDNICFALCFQIILYCSNMTLLSISQMTMDLLPDLTVYIRNTVGVLQEAGTVNPSRASRFTPFVLVWLMLLIF